MNKDLEQFENRSDDWLATERKRENLVSAWDFDEGKKLKEFHEENCEAKYIKEKHERIHQAYYNNQKDDYHESQNKSMNNSDYVHLDEVASRKIKIIILILVIVLVGLLVCNVVMNGDFEFGGFLPLLCFLIVIATTKKKGKK